MADNNGNIPGKRLVITALEDLSEKDPGRKFATIPKGPEISDGFRDITMIELSHAVNYTAW